jgi:CRISPR/Cas system endoribonuclease Cas6 (RAMP superfamily)
MTYIVGQHLDDAKQVGMRFVEATEKNYVSAMNRAIARIPLQTPESVAEVKNLMVDALIFAVTSLICNTVGSADETLENAVTTAVQKKFADFRLAETRAVLQKEKPQ